MSDLLPKTLEEDIKESIKVFWQTRSNGKTSSQEGSRGAVIGGKNLDGFTQIIKNVAVHCGLPESSVVITGRKTLTIPGYFRPTKSWDAIVFHEGHLLAVFELKSQVGSFGNNFNNRSEESIGSASDFWTAHREKAFNVKNLASKKLLKEKKDSDITIQPFLGYLMLLEESDGSTTSVRVDEEYYKVFPEFEDASYATRYSILMQRLITEKLYNSACLILSKEDDGIKDGYYKVVNKSISPKSLFSSFAGHLLSAIEMIEK
ncbi:PaeR7I family type II restriction endonuclease [Gracilimonas mengyeensis]|uniref:Restriction endonuclease XhoI n=1 Tax=Gracilimonas mengyeensis TaxID=1302730 RepID=A0A521BED8_9BACT|nr:PaeR7I family type II restriction endonuclease [Gracilimonas mengyeensis]SMO45423.1 Restriction endonuclease XhoI [Gracilimonas mengyeensis]